MTPMEPTTMNMPVLALRGLTVFPRMNLTFDVERPISIAALERAMEGEQDVFLVTQREISVERPEEKDLYQIGTVSHIRQILRLSSGSARVMVEGRRRARLRRLWQSSPYLQANLEELPEEPPGLEPLQRLCPALRSGAGGDCHRRHGQPGRGTASGLHCPEHPPAPHG